jgi:hypothetical protein
METEVNMTNRFLNAISGRMPLAVATLVLIPSALFAGIPGPHTVAKAAGAGAKANELPIGSKPHGKSYEQWSVLWWQWFLPLTAAQFNACSIGQSGPVAFLLAGPLSCTGSVQPGTALFFPIANIECSNLEPAPFHGDTPAERAACAASFLSIVGTIGVTIDGVPVRHPTSFHALSPDFSFKVGPDNVFGIPCSGECSGLSSGDGYYLMLTPLPPGDHTIHITATGFGLDTTFNLRVGR